MKIKNIYNSVKKTMQKNKKGLLINSSLTIASIFLIFTIYNISNNNKIVHNSEIRFAEYSPKGKLAGGVLPASCESGVWNDNTANGGYHLDGQVQSDCFVLGGWSDWYCTMGSDDRNPWQYWQYRDNSNGTRDYQFTGSYCFPSINIEPKSANIRVGTSINFTIYTYDQGAGIDNIGMGWMAPGQSKWNWQNGGLGGTATYSTISSTDGGRSKSIVATFTPTAEGTYTIYGAGHAPAPYYGTDGHWTITPNYTITVTGDPFGSNDGASCTYITGWTCDPSAYANAIDVHIYDGEANDYTKYIGATTANIAAEDGVKNSCGGYANHRFAYTIPDSYKNGQSHRFTAYAINTPTGGNNPSLGTVTMAACKPPVVDIGFTPKGSTVPVNLQQTEN